MTSCTLFIAALLFPASVVRAQSQCCSMRAEPPQHNFALVVDRSGSMEGAPLQQAVAGVGAFLGQLQAGDRAAVIAFDDRVRLVQPMTGDRRALQQAVTGLTPGGATALYDAIVRAAGVVLAESGPRIVVFLTDGEDNRSHYSLKDIASLGLSEGIFIYGIGLGKVNGPALMDLTGATGGILQLTDDAAQLTRLYRQVLSSYYQTHAARMPESGAYAIRSLPEGAEVRLDGARVGRTPLKLDGVPPGEHLLEVVFQRGVWRCQAASASGQRTYVDAREDDLGHDLWIASRPHGAVVFLDDTYVGTTSMEIVDTARRGWGARVKQSAGQLRIPLVPRGEHVLRLTAMPDVDLGPEQQVVFPFDMSGAERVLQVEIFTRRVTVDDGRVLQQSSGQRVDEHFDQLDGELDMGEDPLGD